MAKKPSKIKDIERRKKMKRINKSNDNYSTDFSSKENYAHIVNTIPVIQEEFSISKKTVTENIKIEKKWNTMTEKIEVPVYFEEVYINGKDLKSYRKEDEDDVLSELNKRIIKSFEDVDDAKKLFSVLEKNESKREVVPIFDDADDNTDNINDITDKETETEKKVIPILGEEIIVNKRIVKLGELILAKNKVTENQKIAVDTIKEKATIRYPDGNTRAL
jgi:stress response protein YsnF